MNSFLFSAITVCLAAQCALAQYQAAPAYGNGYQQQRKMAPTPQTYGQQQQQYQAQQSYEPAAPMSAYEQPAAPSYKQAAQYAESGASSYGKPAAAAPSYARQQASSYAAKPAPKYEEPYYPPMPFAWGYDINDGYGGAQYHKENGDEYGKRTGSYGYTDAYGIYRQVDYVADEHGFRATIKTNEPGTANESPADVDLHAYEPPSNYYAGSSYSPKQQQQAAYSAPVAAAPVASYSAPAAPAAYAAPKPRPQAASYQPAAKAAAAYPQRPQPSYNHEMGQYSSGSSLVPVYQPSKQATRHQAAVAKRY